jgi:PAS domain-containing protein
MELVPLLEPYLKIAGMVVTLALGVTTLWIKLNLTEKAVCLWNKTFGYPVVLIREIHEQLRADDGTPIREQLSRVEQEVQAARVEQHVDFMARKEALFQTDAEGNCIGANTAYLRLVHRTFDEIKGSGWIHIFPHDERPVVAQEWNSAVENERDFDMEVSIREPGGATKQVHAHGFRKIGIDGSIIGYMGRLEPL